MKGLSIVCWLFIIGLMVENGSQSRKIEELRSDVDSIQQDVQVAYEALNNIQNSTTNVVVFDNTYESD